MSSKKINFELDIEDGLELCALFAELSETAKDRIEQDPARANLIIRMAREFPKQISDKCSLEEIDKAIKSADERFD